MIYKSLKNLAREWVWRWYYYYCSKLLGITYVHAAAPSFFPSLKTVSLNVLVSSKSAPLMLYYGSIKALLRIY